MGGVSVQFPDADFKVRFCPCLPAHEYICMPDLDINLCKRRLDYNEQKLQFENDSLQKVAAMLLVLMAG